MEFDRKLWNTLGGAGVRKYGNHNLNSGSSPENYGIR